MTSCKEPDHGNHQQMIMLYCRYGLSLQSRLDKVVGECIFVDKVYDGITLNLQGLQAGNKISFGHLPVSSAAEELELSG